MRTLKRIAWFFATVYSVSFLFLVLPVYLFFMGALAPYFILFIMALIYSLIVTTVWFCEGREV